MGTFDDILDLCDLIVAMVESKHDTCALCDMIVRECEASCEVC